MNVLSNFMMNSLTMNCHLGGEYILKKGGVWEQGPLKFAQNKLYYILEGKCTITIENCKYDGLPGSLFLIPAGRMHSFYNDKSMLFHKYWVHFDLSSGIDCFFDFINLPYVIDVGKNDEILDIFRCISKNKDVLDIKCALLAKAKLLELVIKYITLSGKPSDIHNIEILDDTPFSNVLNHIDKNIHREITVNELATIAYMHPTHFIRYFKKKSGQTPARYIKIAKMQVARGLLETTAKPIGEIMYDIGVLDSSYFSKAFRDVYGMTPTHFRRLGQDIMKRKM